MSVSMTDTADQLESKAWTLEEKVIAFWEKVDRSGGPNACWTWTGAVTSIWHYGCFAIAKGKTRGAHKLAWLFTNGDPKGLCVLHKCDNRVCVNPAHLFLGTKQDNADDKVAKGRQIRGETATSAKLTEEQVREIRREYRRESYGKSNCRELAKRYGVGRGAIRAIVSGGAWNHITAYPD